MFSWRGQFSPELVERLLAANAARGGTVLDPFVGSGTTLHEAARQHLPSIGFDVNPAAIVMANAARFSNLTSAERDSELTQFLSWIDRLWPMPLLIGASGPQDASTASARHKLTRWLESIPLDSPASILVSNLIVQLDGELHRGHDDVPEATIWTRANELRKTIQALPFTTAQCIVAQGDARLLPLGAHTVDYVLTSPPYINVFNYHQHYRTASELMGWDVLRVARSEFGSNRKNRGNRFLTVVEYAIDMASALREMHRVLKPSGIASLVVGRESNVRGTSFANARIVTALATSGGWFRLDRRQERRFKNKFGEWIYEDVIHLSPRPSAHVQAVEVGRSIGFAALCAARTYVDAEARPDLERAIAGVGVVNGSPHYALPQLAEGPPSG